MTSSPYVLYQKLLLLRVISIRRCTPAGFKLTKLFGIDDVSAAKDFGKAFITIIYCFYNYYYYYYYYRLDIHARGFWDRQSSAFFDAQVCHPKDLSPEQINRQHENGKKRSYAKRVLEIEQGTFTPLVFSTTGGMAEGCRRYHSRLAELLAIKKGNY